MSSNFKFRKNNENLFPEEDDDETGACEEEEASEVERELLDGAGELLVAVARNDPAGVIADGFVDILTVAGKSYFFDFQVLTCPPSLPESYARVERQYDQSTNIEINFWKNMW